MVVQRPIALCKYKDITGDGINHVEDMLRNSRIWFSSPRQFNDPFDCRCVFDIRNTREEIVFRKAEVLTKHLGMTLADALAEADKEIPSEPHKVEEWQVQQIEGHSRRAENSGILCLTPVRDNFTMWTHYARNHTGVCIQFRVRDIKDEAHLDFFAAAMPVEYADRCPKINLVRDGMPEFVHKAFLTKSTAFRHELEWRIVQYDQASGLKAIPPGIIDAIFLGCQIDQTAADRIINACQAYDGRVEILRARLDPETYGLKMELEAVA